MKPFNVQDINVLNIHNNWLSFIHKNRDHVAVVADDHTAVLTVLNALASGQELKLANTALGIFGYEDEDGSSVLVWRLSIPGKWHVQFGVNKQGLKENIADAMYYVKSK